MEIEEILKLARIEIPKNEKKKLKEDFSKILNFVKKLNEAKTEKVDLEVKKDLIEIRLREDKEKRFKNSKEILKLFPQKKKGFLKVKKIL